MKRYSILIVFALFLVLPSSFEAVECEFVLGFKTLRDLIGHDIVGECLENERYAANGNSEQHTTGGLLVWRKADNQTVFTDGYHTWINGPNGLVQRLNTERFAWEADYAPRRRHCNCNTDTYTCSPAGTHSLAHTKAHSTDPANASAQA